MPRDVLYFTLALLALYLVFDQFVGNKKLSALSDTLWNKNQTKPAEEVKTIIS